MVELADHDQHAARAVAQRQLPFHRQFACQRGELGAEGIARDRARIEFDAHEEGVAHPVVELLRFEDVAAALEQE